jgi:hypothetical protein
MDGDGHVGRNGRRPRRRDPDAALPLRERVGDVREPVVALHVNELEVGERRLVERAPVDDPVRTVDVVLAIEVDKPPHDGAHVVVVHGEALAAVVERGAHPPELGHDRPPVQAEPLPDPRLEGLAPELLPRCPLAQEVLLHHILGRDPSMVVAGLEESVVPLHAPPADERVGQGELERVAHVQLAGDVRRRVGDREGLAAAFGVGLVMALLLPGLLPALLDALRAVQRLHSPDSRPRVRSPTPAVPFKSEPTK